MKLMKRSTCKCKIQNVPITTLTHRSNIPFGPHFHHQFDNSESLHELSHACEKGLNVSILNFVFIPIVSVENRRNDVLLLHLQAYSFILLDNKSNNKQASAVLQVLCRALSSFSSSITSFLREVTAIIRTQRVVQTIDMMHFLYLSISATLDNYRKLMINKDPFL